jgi:hypothetical protein
MVDSFGTSCRSRRAVAREKAVVVLGLVGLKAKGPAVSRAFLLFLLNTSSIPSAP